LNKIEVDLKIYSCIKRNIYWTSQEVICKSNSHCVNGS